MNDIDLKEVAEAVAAGQARGESVGVSWLQRKLRIGFHKATRLKQQLEAMGVVFFPIVWEGEPEFSQDELPKNCRPDKRSEGHF